MRFFAWCSACLKYHISSIFKCCKILTIFAVFHGKFWSETFSSFLKMDQNWFYLIEQASDMSKIKLLLIFYVCCFNKTTKTINELTNEQPSSLFFLTDPLHKINHNNNYHCIQYHTYFIVILPIFIHF